MAEQAGQTDRGLLRTRVTSQKNILAGVPIGTGQSRAEEMGPALYFPFPSLSLSSLSLP